MENENKGNEQKKHEGERAMENNKYQGRFNGHLLCAVFFHDPFNKISLHPRNSGGGSRAVHCDASFHLFLFL